MKITCCIVSILIIGRCFGQTDRKLSAFVSFQVSATQYDRTITNNAVGFGAGLQLYLRTHSRLRPALDISSDIFGGTKEQLVDADGKPVYAKDGVTNIFAGAYLQATPRLFATLTAGPSFVNDNIYLGIKPTLGYYLVKGRQLAFKISLTNIFQRDDFSNQSFGYWNFALVLKLF